MSGIEITRRKLASAELRMAAGTCRDAKAARRMLALALALVLEGVDRRRAAQMADLAAWVNRARSPGSGPNAAPDPVPPARYPLSGRSPVLSDQWRLPAHLSGAACQARGAATTLENPAQSRNVAPEQS